MISCILLKNVFGRWVIVNRKVPTLAWSGQQWVPHQNGVPSGQYQVCNFLTREEALKAAPGYGLKVEA